MPMFADRTEAGRQLAVALEAYRASQPLVIGLPRGGVVVAAEVAAALDAPLDVLVVRKLGAPGSPEFAIGAVTARGTRVLNEAALRRLWLPPGYMQREIGWQREEARQREVLLRGVRPAVPLAGRQVILVDDGIATGMTARAALADVREQGPRSVVLAAPVIAPDTAEELGDMVDDLVAIARPADFTAVGEFYANFAQTTDDTVRRLLAARLARHQP